jgi:uncharacterized protein (DUF1330 family)
LKDVQTGPQIVEYLTRIDATLAPYGGRFIVDGGSADVREGTDPRVVIIIEFPAERKPHAGTTPAPTRR